MKLDPRFVKLVYKISDTDPTITETNLENIPEGALWVNEKTGKVFIAIKYPNNPTKIVWLSISNTPEDILSQFSFPTYNIVDIFNDNSIVAFYPFDGNAQDLANGYNGTWHGNEQYSSGKFGQAAKFDGNSWIVIENNIDEIIDWWNNNFTISVWATFDNITRNWQRIIDFKGKILIATFNDTGNFTLHMQNLSEQQSKSVTFNSKPVQGEFHHYLFVKENNLCKLYIDGNLVEEVLLIVEQYSAPQTSNNLVGYSNWPNNNDIPYLGKFDQLRIFNRPLTDEEIIILYNENYLIKKALSILIDKFRTYKEIVFFPAGDIPSIQTGTKFHGGQIGQVTDTKPVIKDTGKETMGKELYFPNNSAIELKFDQDITVPFTLTTILQVNKLEQTQGIVDKTILGIDYNGTPTDGNFDYWIYLHHGKELSVNIGAHSVEQNLSESSPKIAISPSRKYLIVNTVKQNEMIFKVYDFKTKQIVGDFSFNIEQSLSKLREPRLALGAWIYTSDSGQNANKFSRFSNCGLHINQFRIFKGILTNKEINLLLNEDKFYPVRTQYTPKVFVNKPSLNEDLVLFYNFDKIDAANKKVIDLSGNGYDGIWNGTPQYDKGIFGRVAKFNEDSYILVNPKPNLGNQFTISFWIKSNNTNNSNDSVIQLVNTNGSSGSENLFEFWFKNTQGNTVLTINGTDYILHSVNEILNQWVHYALVVSDKTYIYRNGKLIKIINEIPNMSRYTRFQIGADWDSSNPNTDNYKGLLDQLRVYKRALTEDEIQTLYREMLWTIK